MIDLIILCFGIAVTCFLLFVFSTSIMRNAEPIASLIIAYFVFLPFLSVLILALFCVIKENEFLAAQCKYDIHVSHLLANLKHGCVKSYKKEGRFLVIVDAYGKEHKADIGHIAYMTEYNTLNIVEVF